MSAEHTHRQSNETNEAKNVNIVQSGASRVRGDHVSIKQGGTIVVDARQLELFQGGVVYARGDQLDMKASQAGVVLARGPAEIEQTAAGLVATAGPVHLEQSASGIVLGREVQMNRSASVFVIAKNISGQFRALFGPKESLLFAIVAGLAAGIGFALTRVLAGDRKNRRED